MNKSIRGEQDNLMAAVEAILFVYGEPMESVKIAKLLKVHESAVTETLRAMGESYKDNRRGLTLILGSGKIQLATNPEFSTLLEDFIKEETKESLTPASLEALSLIAYLGPIPRSELDYYRGVNSSFILRNLLVRGLVNRIPHPEKANAYFYEVSFDLLKFLGISKAEELPDYEHYKHQRMTK